MNAQMQGVDQVFAATETSRRGLPITFTVDDTGVQVPLSFYGDEVIDFAPYMPSRSVSRSRKTISLRNVPAPWRDRFTDIVLAYWHFGVPGQRPPKASTVVSKAIYIEHFIRFCDGYGLNSLAELKPLHIAAYVEHSKTRPSLRGGKLRSSALVQIFWAVDLIFRLSPRLSDRIGCDPFLDSSLQRVAGHSDAGPRRAVTRALDMEEAAQLSAWCDRKLDGAERNVEIAQGRDAVERQAMSDDLEVTGREWRVKRYLAVHGYRTIREFDAVLRDIRSACLIQLAMVVGCRIHESHSLDVGAYFEREVDGETLGWVRGISLKTTLNGEEHVSWLAPPIAKRLVNLLEGLTASAREQLEADIAGISALIELAESNEKARLFANLQEMLGSRNSILLAYWTGRKKASDTYLGVLSDARSNALLADAAKEAGISGHVTWHVLRRTFATLVVHQCGGDLRYLKEHFKHWSLDMTMLYAAHEEREQAMIDEILEQVDAMKARIVRRITQPNAVLSGRGGIYMKAVSGEFVGRLVSGSDELAGRLAEGLIIRPNGHSTCVASGKQPCGGQGIYDPLLCADCDNAVIEEHHASVWLLLEKQMQEVVDLDDCGPAGRQLATAGLENITELLKPFAASIQRVESEASA